MGGVVALAALTSLAACSDAGETATGVKVGDHPPSLALEAVQDPIGVADHGLDAYKGKVLVLGFWLGGCAPCLKEMPELVELRRRYGAEGLDVLLVNTGGNRKAVDDAIADNGIDFAMAMDALNLSSQRFEVGVFPTTFILDRDGVIRARMAGEHRPGDIAREATALLGAKGPDA